MASIHAPFLALAAMAAVFLLAGLVKGVVGLGLPTVAMALLALLMPPAQAAALLIVPSLVTNVWQMRPWATLGPLARRLAGMQVGVVLGTLAGAWVFGAPAGAWAEAALGIALLAYAAWGLAGIALAVPPRHAAWLGPLVGAVTGVVTAATGVFAVPAVPYLQALGLQRDALVQAMGLSFTVSTVALAATLLLAGGPGFGQAMGSSVLMLLPALAGMALGQVLRQRLSLALFRRCFLVSLALLGLYMAGRPLLGH
ncbi:MAG: sulfite exporter TauE/SafE family protein [Pseudomonadota bacterium]